VLILSAVRHHTRSCLSPNLQTGSSPIIKTSPTTQTQWSWTFTVNLWSTTTRRALSLTLQTRFDSQFVLDATATTERSLRNMLPWLKLCIAWLCVKTVDCRFEAVDCSIITPANLRVEAAREIAFGVLFQRICVDSARNHRSAIRSP